MADVLWRSAAEQAELVRSGEVSARELVEATLSAIDEVNGELNAVVTRCDERALAEAENVKAGDERPLAGVPVLVKDLLALTEGVRTTFGMAAMEEWVPPLDSAHIRRLKEAGAIIAGKTNTPELGILPVTEPDRFGPCRNPWDLSRTCGGSSGGSASAVAAGVTAVAHANDGGGSIRIPASCCGLVGLKPTRGRVSLSPAAEAPGGIAIELCVSRTVRDTATYLDVVSGYEAGDPYSAPPPSAPFVEAVGREPGRLRIALATTPPDGQPIDPECEAAARSAAELLASLGHELEEAAPDWADEQMIETFIAVWAAGIGEAVRGLGLVRGEPLDESRLEPLTAALLGAASDTSAIDLLLALDHLTMLSRRTLALWTAGGFDAVLTPTLGQPPIPIGALDPAPGEPPIQRLMNCIPFVPFTPIVNVTGQPAISLPLHWNDAGLPIGVHLIGPPAGEEMLLSLAAQVEDAQPWRDRRPPVAAGAAAAA
jgi:amidase